MLLTEDQKKAKERLANAKKRKHGCHRPFSFA